MRSLTVPGICHLQSYCTRFCPVLVADPRSRARASLARPTRLSHNHRRTKSNRVGSPKIARTMVHLCFLTAHDEARFWFVEFRSSCSRLTSANCLSFPSTTSQTRPLDSMLRTVNAEFPPSRRRVRRGDERTTPASWIS